MPISSSRYVDITSSVAAQAEVSTRQLILRLFTTNTAMATGTLVSYGPSSLSTTIADRFGTDSEEYKQAAFYFGFVSKQSRSPSKIQFVRWAQNDEGAYVLGSTPAALATLQAYTEADLTITLNGTDFVLSGVDISSGTDFASIAAILQTAIQAAGGALASATVTYSATEGAFILETNGTADGTISISSTTDFADNLGWGSDALFSAGVSAQSVTDLLDDSESTNNNFLSFAFIDDLTEDEATEAAAWADGENVNFMYCCRVTADDYSDIQAAVSGYSGTALTLYDADNADYPWLLPAALAASIDWSSAQASQNFMYVQDDSLTATVTNDSDADTYDALLINYYGETQEAGSDISFYQRGYLQGGSSYPQQMGVFVNEAWLKSEIRSSLLSAQLALPQISKGTKGIAIVKSYIVAAAKLGLDNGVIISGQTLDTTAKNYIAQVTGDSDAYQDVQSNGYYLMLSVTSATNNGVVEYTATYTLIYTKNDSVNTITGTHTLI